MPIAFPDSIQWADYYYNIHRYRKAIPLYKKNLGESEKEKPRILKRLALSEAALENPIASLDYLYDYLIIDFEPSFLLNEGFDNIRDNETFNKVTNQILPKLNGWSLFYFFISLIGVYIIATLMFNKKIDLLSKILVISFIFIHSLFLLNITTYLSNYVMVYPHTHLMSTWSALLYGPLLYLYFKRTAKKVDFTPFDFLHFAPTLLLIIYLVPTAYLISGDQKIQLLLENIIKGPSSSDSNKLFIIVVLKTISLSIYAYFSHMVLKRISNSKMKVWHRNIYCIHIIYIISYIAYGTSINLGVDNVLLFHIPLIAMGMMVLYLGYAANVQPNVFSGLYAYTNHIFPKYIKSGLTDSLSFELKLELIQLFNQEKLYKRSDINLDLVAQELNTTRHNTSQLINEQFRMNFRELINTYRIKEAKELLEKNNKSNIIDIAYEVGYNNKVSFNKAFKKDTGLTPSQYITDVKARTYNG